MHDDSPKVSIIVPVYNVEKYIEQCARSIFEQTYQNLEIIFVNDCTPDGSIDVLQQLINEYPARKQQTQIINHSNNRGLAAARATGIKNCTGKYVLNIDSDDYIETSMVSTLIKVATDGDCDIVAASFFHTSPDSDETAVNIKDCQGFFDLNNIPIDTLHFSQCNKIIRKSIFDQLPDTPGANCWEDLAMTARAFALARNTAAINVPLYHYRIGENAYSLTAQSHDKRLRDQITVARFVERWFADNHLSEQYAPFIKNMKFAAKIKYLRGKKRDFAAWKNTFPEANHGILGYKHIPLHYRLMFFIANILPTPLCQWCSNTLTPQK